MSTGLSNHDNERHLEVEKINFRINTLKKVNLLLF